VDFYYHSIRFVPANVAWGVGLVGVLALAVFVHPILALIVAPLLAVPLVGVAALAATAGRDRDVVLSDAWAAWRRHGLVAVAAGGLITLATIVLATNLAAGLASGGVLGWSIATLAGWGLVALWTASFPFWVLVADPAGGGRTGREAARLTGLLLLAHPARFAVLGGGLVVVLLVSTVLFAALMTISVAFALLAAARVTLPAADRLTR
jgi:hypothetical protein